MSKSKVKSPANSAPKKSNLVDRNLMKVNPLKEQFEPTDKSPVPQHKKMAGQP